MDITEMIQLYSEGKSLTFLANKYGTYPEKIKNILQAQGIKTRTHAEQNRITNQERGKKVNHSYFDNIDSLQKAWLLGFLAADGSITPDRNSIKLGLSSVDREILEKIQKELDIERNIADKETNQGFQVSTLAWSSENHKKKLAQFSIVPNKTYKGMKLPAFEQQYQLAFFLGYFDGDGCFKNDGKYCRIEICSYDPNILQDFTQLIDTVFHIPREVYKEPKKQHYYTITYSTQQAELILNSLYKLMNQHGCFYLQRKYIKYLTWKEQNNRI